MYAFPPRNGRDARPTRVMSLAKYCPKSDEGVRSAVKQGALVIGLGKAALPVAESLRASLGYRARKGDGWEESRVHHLVVVVECMPMTGDCCEAAEKFMRDVRKSDGYPVYSEIIGRKVAVLALGKMDKVAGAAKVEEVLLKRGGCTRLIAPPSIGTVATQDAVAALEWMRAVSDALEATMDPPPHPSPPPPPPPPPPPLPPPPPTEAVPKPPAPPVSHADSAPSASQSVVAIVTAAVVVAALLIGVVANARTKRGSM